MRWGDKIEKDLGPRDLAHATRLFDSLIDDVDLAARDCLVRHRDFFLRVIEGSGFLARLMRQHSDILGALGGMTADDLFAREVLDFESSAKETSDRTALMALARITRGRLALIIALADLAGDWDCDATTAALSSFADCAVATTIAWLFVEAYQMQRLTRVLSPSDSGLIILAMGKHGACELNYSSDIDLVVFYASDIELPLASQISISQFYIALTRDLVSILQTPTSDGYVWRVDLRLRPDPAATMVALSTVAALSYYEGFGQNWERAAFIKARPIAGNRAVADAFLASLAPFIWRRSLDFATLEDIHTMKRQYHTVHGHAALAIAGHNIKIGRGGIREIEFFVQTQQLIAGGRDLRLRVRRSCDALDALAVTGWVSSKAAVRLKDCYFYLRTIEHRLQMRLDQQTHSLPSEFDDLEAFARFAGYVDFAGFAADLRMHQEAVVVEYDRLFEVVGGEDHFDFVMTLSDETASIERLEALGFTRTGEIIDELRGWQAGRIRATRTARAQKLLTHLLPQIMKALSRGLAPDDSFMRFAQFLRGLPSGIQLFSLFQSNPQILTLLIDIMATAPYLGKVLAASPSRLDVMLDRDFWSRTKDTSDFANFFVLRDGGGLSSQRDESDHGEGGFEDRLDAIRVFVHEQQFRFGVHMLAHPDLVLESAMPLSALADFAIGEVVKVAIDEMRSHYGAPESVDFAVLGLGRLGSREMTINSDLDLIMIYVPPVGFCSSVKTDMTVWFSRLARRVVSCLTMQTVHGGLYQVDTRLRPSGNSGPIATRLSSFIAYQNHDAWSWEHMALMRGRVICGPPGLASKIDTAIMDILTRPRAYDRLVSDVLAMRKRLLEHRPRGGRWDMKQGAGGLIDIEFLVQLLQLAYAEAYPSLVTPSPVCGLSELCVRGVISDDDSVRLNAAYRALSITQQILRLCLSTADESLPRATEGLLSVALDVPSSRLSGHLEEHRRSAHDIFSRYFLS